METKEETLWNEFNQDKWMMYEKEIIKYYYPKLKEWLKKENKWANTDFTSGLGRDIARLIEDGIRIGEEQGQIKAYKKCLEITIKQLAVLSAHQEISYSASMEDTINELKYIKEEIEKELKEIET